MSFSNIYNYLLFITYSYFTVKEEGNRKKRNIDKKGEGAKAPSPENMIHIS
jgi:hypothetical protein